MATKLPVGIEDERRSSETIVGHFKPVPLRPRHDGWTAQKRIAFIVALADARVEE